MTDFDKLVKYNTVAKSMVDFMLETQTPFFVVIDPKTNWEPELPDEYREKQGVLFHIIDDSLTESVVGETVSKLLVAIPTDNGLSLHYYSVDEYNKIILIGESKGRDRGRVLLERPEFIFNMKDVEDSRLHSLNHFLQNPDNEKFFK